MSQRKRRHLGQLKEERRLSKGINLFLDVFSFNGSGSLRLNFVVFYTTQKVQDSVIEIPFWKELVPVGFREDPPSLPPLPSSP